MTECVFCGLRDTRAPGSFVHEDEHCFVLRDIEPQAPMHLLVVPRRHIATLNDVTATDAPLLGHLLYVATRLASAEGQAAPGWRAVVNVNPGGHQTVFHIHLHVLGGRAMGWPPG